MGMRRKLGFVLFFICLVIVAVVSCLPFAYLTVEQAIVAAIPLGIMLARLAIYPFAMVFSMEDD